MVKATAREYAGPLSVLTAGAIGIVLLCSVSAVAMQDLKRPSDITLEPVNIIDLAISNLNTVEGVRYYV